jgi:hypothetical protein
MNFRSSSHIDLFWRVYLSFGSTTCYLCCNYPQNQPTRLAVRHSCESKQHARGAYLTSFVAFYFFYLGGLGEDSQKVDGEPSISNQGRFLGILPEDLPENF